MNKRYQVFVSSTFEDLQDERLDVMKAILELDCIPCGMEYFPAANEDRWTFIQKLIKECDYYIVIIAGRYGSLAPDGFSYTQKEYEYAISENIPTIGFIHRNIEDLPQESLEKTPENKQKLRDFTGLVQTKLCKDWGSIHELGAVVSRSLTQLIKNSPRIGWVRTDKVGNEELLEQLNNLRQDNDTLKNEIENLKKESSFLINIDNIAFENPYKVFGTYQHYFHGYSTYEWEHDTTWKDLFKIIGPFLLQWTNEETISWIIAKYFVKRLKSPEELKHISQERIDTHILQQIKIQFIALGLISVQTLTTTSKTLALFWGLTSKGKQLMLNEFSIKK